MDKDALAKFRTIFQSHAVKDGKQEIVLRDGGMLTITGRGEDVGIRISLPRRVQFIVQKLGDIIEVWIREGVEVQEFHVYVKKGGITLAPNGWVVNTSHKNMVTLAIF